jgi:hypothetical protein
LGGITQQKERKGGLSITQQTGDRRRLLQNHVGHPPQRDTLSISLLLCD